jgi:serine/threonine protein kinase
MAVSSFFGGNIGLFGTPLIDCNSISASRSIPPGKDVDSPRAKIVMIIAATVGGVSLILILVILYLMRQPREAVDSFADTETQSPDSDIYFPPKDGFTFQDLLEATKRFHESYVIGSGACGTVYKAVMKSGKTIAVKKLASNREGNNVDDSFRAEISTLGRIRHRNIVKLYGFCYHQGSNLLLYEYMERGSLGELLHGSASNLEWPTRFMIALGAAEGLAYLHHDCKPKIIHRDIKSNNILLDENFEAHVGDFGLAKVIDMPQSKSMSAVAGSYGYIAPEYAYTMKVTEKCDIYSYGVVLLELLTGKTPVQPMEQGGDLVTWTRNHIRNNNNTLSSEMLDNRLDLEDQITINHMLTVLKLALMCTSMTPTKRPSMREVVLMLIESNEREGNLTLTQTNHDPPSKDST